MIKETLRLHSPIHSLMRKVMNPLPIEETKWVVPRGHILLASPDVTSRSEEHFANPTTWDPHRWDDHVELMDEDDNIDYDYGLVSKRTKSPYLPFEAGRHRCIGEQFAYLNLAVILAVMMRNFKLRNLDEAQGAVVNTDYSVRVSPLVRLTWNLSS